MSSRKLTATIEKTLKFIFIFILLIMVFFCLLVWVANKHSPLFRRVGEPVTSDALQGINLDTIRIIWQEDLASWSSRLPDKSILTLFEAQTLETKSIETRVAFGSGEQQHYLGVLTPQLNEAPVQTIFLEIEDTRYIVGIVNASVDGNLTFLSMRNSEGTNKASENEKTSAINNRVFFIPIFANELPQWENISWIGITTKETSNKAIEAGTLNFYEWEATFASPINLSPFWKYVDITE